MSCKALLQMFACFTVRLEEYFTCPSEETSKKNGSQTKNINLLLNSLMVSVFNLYSLNLVFNSFRSLLSSSLCKHYPVNRS
jgi:hypothetical protein